jgi:hypothetical protein
MTLTGGDDLLTGRARQGRKGMSNREPAGRPALDQINCNELALFHGLLQSPRVSNRPHQQRTIDLGTVANRDLLGRVPGDGKGWLDLGPSRDLSGIKPGGAKTPFMTAPLSSPCRARGAPSACWCRASAGTGELCPELVRTPVRPMGSSDSSENPISRPEAGRVFRCLGCVLEFGSHLRSPVLRNG